jgi:hypothetical protein
VKDSGDSESMHCSLHDRRELMAAKKARQTMEKIRREQERKRRRDDKLQKKAERRLAKVSGIAEGEASQDVGPEMSG